MKIPALSLLILLAACSGQQEPNDLDRLDNELTDANGSAQRDPALRSALAGQIMVDPALAQSADSAVRAPDRLAAGEVPPDIARPDPVDPKTLKQAPPATGPSKRTEAAHNALTLGALAGHQPDSRTAGCAGAVAYSASWSNRLPAAFPLYPDARVTEAAGNDAGGCHLRIVSFASSAKPDKMINFYFTHASRAGFSAERQADSQRQVLGGTQGDAAYVVYVSPRRDGGSDVDLITNAGS